MICISCGKEIAPNSKFCPECGAKVTVRSHGISDEMINSQSIQAKQQQSRKRAKALPRWPFIVLLLLIIAVIGFLAYEYYRTDSTPENSITPYGVQWGDSPETVMKKDKNAVEGGVNGNGEKTYRDGEIYGSFFNLKDDTIKSPIMVYRFVDDKLSGIIYMCGINTDVISPDSFVDGIMAYYFAKFNSEPDYQTFKYVWSSDEGTVEVVYLTDDLFSIEYLP